MKKFDLSNYNRVELREYLESHPDLSKEKVTEIKVYMEKLLKDGMKMMDKWIESKMFKLSASQLKREGKAKVINCGGRIRFTVDPLEAMIKGNEILISAHKKNIEL